MFTLGSSVAQLSENILVEWLEFLLAAATRDSVSIALNLVHFYYGHKESKHALPRDLTLRVLIAPALFEKVEGQPRRQMDTYHWTELGKLFAGKFPDESVAIAERMLECFGEDGTIVERFHSSSHRFSTRS